jgi:hypothetical protein
VIQGRGAIRCRRGQDAAKGYKRLTGNTGRGGLHLMRPDLDHGVRVASAQGIDRVESSGLEKFY